MAGLKLQYKRSGDKTSTFTDDWIDIVESDVKDGIPSALELETGRIEVKYFKTLIIPPATTSVEKWYRSYTDNIGTDPIVWTEEEVTT